MIERKDCDVVVERSRVEAAMTNDPLDLPLHVLHLGADSDIVFAKTSGQSGDIPRAHAEILRNYFSCQIKSKSISLTVRHNVLPREPSQEEKRFNTVPSDSLQMVTLHANRRSESHRRIDDRH